MQTVECETVNVWALREMEPEHTSNYMGFDSILICDTHERNDIWWHDVTSAQINQIVIGGGAGGAHKQFVRGIIWELNLVGYSYT